MAAPGGALALTSSYCASASSHLGLAEQAGRKRGSQARGACPVLPGRKMALPFARSLCLCHWGARRLGVAAVEARRGRIISFYSLILQNGFRLLFPNSSWVASPHPTCVHVDYKPMTDTIWFLSNPGLLPSELFGSLGCPY